MRTMKSVTIDGAKAAKIVDLFVNHNFSYADLRARFPSFSASTIRKVLDGANVDRSPSVPRDRQTRRGYGCA